MDVQEHELCLIYSWVDEMPLSRPKRNIHRDFADGVLVAEILALYMPKLINLHNYTACSAMNLKLYNWDTLQDRAFRRLGRKLTASDCLGCTTARPGAIERVLRLLQHLLLDGSQVSKSPRESLPPPVAWQSESSKGSSAHQSAASVLALLMVVLLLLLCQLACFQQAKSGQPPKPLLSWRTAASQDDPKIPFWSLNKVAREACGKHGIIRALSAAPGAAGRPCNNLNSPTSQLEAAQHELNSHGSKASSGGTMEEGSHAETADTTASEFEIVSVTGGVPHSYDTNGAESIAAIEKVAGPEDITCLSVELVEGALGESADYLIPSYGTYDLQEDTLKPVAFKAAAAAQPDKSTSALATQDKTQELESRIAQLEMDNERLKRVIGLHKQRCCILEEACLTNGVHVPGGLLAHQHG